MLSEIYNKKFSEAGFEVVMAASGTEAQTKAKSEKPDLMLLDLVLPEEDGFGVLGKIKGDESTKGIKVIIFSNLSQEEDKQKAKSLGADGFIAKSDYTPHQIVDQVNKIMGNGELPNQENTSSPQDSSGDEKKISSQGDDGNGRHKVLLVEDEQVFIEVFSKKLEEEGFRVDVANNGAWGAKQTEEKKYDLIILDILMPNLNGLEVIEKIRQGATNKETPVIAISNSVEDEKVQEAIKMGANEFYVKTRITPSELAGKAKDLIG